MVDRLTANLQGLETRAIWTVKCADVTKVDFEPCDVIILNYCLQFVPISQRPHLLRRLYAALKPGGSLYLSEKVHETNKQMNQRLRLIIMLSRKPKAIRTRKSRTKRRASKS